MVDGCLLYYITDRKIFGPDEPTRRRCLLKKIAEAGCAGVDYIQLREKDLSTRELESLTRKAVGVLKELRNESPDLKAALLINSRTDVAIATDADGVHLRSDDISPSEVKRIWASRSGSACEPLIGVSCHSPAEVAQAETNGATFAVFGPVFEKKDIPIRHPAGLAQLREACKSKIPVLALGGVTLESAKQCLESGARGIAAIRLFQENRVSDVVQFFRQS